jgi:hypothetical protein
VSELLKKKKQGAARRKERDEAKLEVASAEKWRKPP